MDESFYLSGIPKGTLIYSYMEMTSGTEICPRFRFFSILGAIGSAVNRKVWFQRSSRSIFSTLFPNPWIVLIGPQGKGHKSSALKQSIKLLKTLPINKRPTFISSKITPEALVKSLATQRLDVEEVDEKIRAYLTRNATGLIYSSEFGVFIGKKDYNQGMLPLLTDLYDCPDEWDSSTIGRGNDVLVNVCLSVMAASTADWMREMLPRDAFKGGFMSRLILVPFPERWNVRVADPQAPLQELVDECTSLLLSITNIKGQAQWDEEAKKFFEEWYMSLPSYSNGHIAAYMERKQDHLLKLAIILMLNELPDELTIKQKHLEKALSVLNYIEPDVMKIVQFISTEPKMRAVEKLLEILNYHHPNPVLEKEVMDYVWPFLGSVREFDDIVAFLLRKETITRTLTSKGTMYSLKETVKGGK